ncbi:winged helix-turn-helix domain-containing protein [Shewanella sp. 3_MG-2023]|uniref:winged helix-turn-helix domain-containing protein n=1 Tax=Shewanella sp. 3_MG-2023 TaxID=3062635 RepID=UPI0026E1736E|nr:winged helix-turn-helix domain-containing protein [Shewanella sp. 3_MG-2023]MDO6776793.1 winged helix-turn-helix domain-containing protein [Shewanella sp. 3_MG-2023]
MLLLANLLFDSDKQTLTDARTGEQHSLSFSENAVLKHLILAEGVATKTDLQSAGWPNRNATDASLNQCISTLRRKLASDESIELKTIPRHGYALNAPQATKQNKHTRATLTMKAMVILIFLSIIIAVIGYRLWQPSSVNLPFKLCQQHPLTAVIEATSEDHCDSLPLPIINPSQPQWLGQHNHYYSLAMCPEGDCAQTGLLNTVSHNALISSVQLQQLTQKIQLTTTPSRNQLTLPKAAVQTTELTEQHYNNYIYYPTESGDIVRVDFRMALLYNEDKAGIMTVDACISLLNCDGASIQFQARYQFNEQQIEQEGHNISVFFMTVDHQHLTPDQHLGKQGELFTFYSSLRRSLLFDNDIRYYRLQDDEHYGVWQLPLLGNPVAWLHRQQLAL